MLNDYDWAEPLHAPIQVDSRLQGDEWLDHLFRRITETTRCTEQHVRNEGPFGYLHTLSGGTLRSSLLISRSADNRPICHVLGHGDKQSEDIDPWVEAVAYAVAQLGKVSEFPWWAVIGEDPDKVMAPNLQLARVCTVGNVELHPNPGLFFEVRPGNSLSSATTVWTFPVRVHGSNAGYNWNVASQEAVADLKTICSLLSLASGRIWRLRQTPQLALSIPDSLPIEAAPSLPQYSLLFPDDWKREDNYGEPTSFEVPPWLDVAWTKLHGNSKLRQLVATYHESLLLEGEKHDSYALIASVAIVEAIGNLAYKKLPKCPECKLIKGATERFRSALARVMDSDNAVALTKVVYGQRSKTAHDGVLHGTEFIAGSYGGPVFMSDNPPVEFGHTARVLRNAAAKLLRLELASD